MVVVTLCPLTLKGIKAMTAPQTVGVTEMKTPKLAISAQCVT